MTSTELFTIPAHDHVSFHGQTRIKAICQKLTVCLNWPSGLPLGVIATDSVNCISQGREKNKLPVELENHLSQDAAVGREVPI